MEILKVLLEITVYSAVIFLGIMIFKKVNRGKISPILSFALWMLLIARLCLPVTLQSNVSLITLPEEPAPIQEEAREPASQQAALPEAQTAAYRQQESAARSERLDIAPAANEAATQPLTQAPKADIPALLVGIWLAGMAVMAVWTAIVAIRLDRTVRKKSVPAPRNIHKIYIQCRHDMGIRRSIPLLVTRNIASPALVVSARPRLLLPLRFVEQATDEQVRFALTHELTHYKRRDHWMCMLMRVLECIHWFNPVVRLAQKQIILDMETACDSAIVRGMHKLEKKSYADTILSMFSRKGEPQLMLGMALTNSRNVAERRIRGIFMKRTTQNGVKLASLLLVAVMLIACFTTACQPVRAENTEEPAAQEEQAPETTEEPAAMDDAETEAGQDEEDQAEAPAQAEKYTAQEQPIDKLDVRFDADVVKPATGVVPVVDIKTRSFTEDDVKKVADYFFDGQEMYDPWLQTKAELQAEIDKLQARVDELDAFVAEYESDPSLKEKAEQKLEELYNSGEDYDWSSYAELEEYGEYMAAPPEKGMLEYDIEKNKELMANAPDTTDRKPVTIQFRDENLGNVGGVESGVETLMDEDIVWNTAYVWADSADGGISEVRGFRDLDRNGLQDSISYTRNYSREHSAYVYGFGQEPIPALTMPQGEAQALAERAVAAIYPELTLAGAFEDIDIVYDIASKGEVERRIYTFIFSRNVDGVQVTVDRWNNYEYVEEELFVDSFESIEIQVDNNGIFGFDWRCPYTDVNVAQADAVVVPVEEAAKAFAKYCADGIEKTGYLLPEGNVENEGAEDELYGWGLDNITANVDRIELGLTRVKLGEGSYQLVPTWDFWGTLSATKDGQPQEYNSFTDDEKILGTVNALDGTAFDRSNRTAGDMAIW